MIHSGSITKSEREAIAAAEAAAFRAGFEARGQADVALGVKLAAVFLERMGHLVPAQLLREARIVEGDTGQERADG